MRVQTTAFPVQSVLYRADKAYDYTDSYQHSLAHIAHANAIRAVDVGKAFFSSSPAWVSQLFGLRNKLVGIFGLKTTGGAQNSQEKLAGFTWQPGERLGLFKVFAKTDQELVVGEDDKHLDFRVSLYLHTPTLAQEEKLLVISTTVKFHNWWGRLYFLPVKPLHQLIVPAMLKGVVRELEKQAPARIAELEYQLTE